MKKLLFVPLMILAMLLGSFQVTKAQNTVTNGTACTMLVVVAWGVPGGCVTSGSAQVIVPAGATVTLPNPPGTIIKASKGYEVGVGFGCPPYYVSQPGCGYPQWAPASCTCGSIVKIYANGDLAFG